MRQQRLVAKLLSEKGMFSDVSSSYMAYHSAELKSSPTLAELMCSGSEVALDLFMVMTKIRDSKIGKGW